MATPEITLDAPLPPPPPSTPARTVARFALAGGIIVAGFSNADPGDLLSGFVRPPPG